MNRIARIALGVAIGCVFVLVGCNSKQARTEEAVKVFGTMLEECINYNETYKNTPEVKALTGFDRAIDQNTNLFKNEQAKLVAAIKGTGEDALLAKVIAQAETIEQVPQATAFALGVSGLPTSAPTKAEVVITTWTKGLTKVMQPRLIEIRKIGEKRS